MHQDTTTPPTLPYAKAPACRRWLAILLFLCGGVAQFGLWFVCCFAREVRWVDRTAWVLEFPLVRLVWALGLTLPNAAFIPLGLLNGLCWSGMVLACVWFLRRRCGV